MAKAFLALLSASEAPSRAVATVGPTSTLLLLLRGSVASEGAKNG